MASATASSTGRARPAAQAATKPSSPRCGAAGWPARPPPPASPGDGRGRATREGLRRGQEADGRLCLPRLPTPPVASPTSAAPTPRRSRSSRWRARLSRRNEAARRPSPCARATLPKTASMEAISCGSPLSRPSATALRSGQRPPSGTPRRSAVSANPPKGMAARPGLSRAEATDAGQLVSTASAPRGARRLGRAHPPARRERPEDADRRKSLGPRTGSGGSAQSNWTRARVALVEGKQGRRRSSRRRAGPPAGHGPERTARSTHPRPSLKWPRYRNQNDQRAPASRIASRPRRARWLQARRRAQVVVIRLEPVEPPGVSGPSPSGRLGRLGQGQEGRRGAPGRRLLPARRQPLQAELADRLQHREARLAVRLRLLPQQALVDERGERQTRSRSMPPGRPRPRSTGLRRLQREAADEDGTGAGRAPAPPASAGRSSRRWRRASSAGGPGRSRGPPVSSGSRRSSRASSAGGRQE